MATSKKNTNTSTDEGAAPAEKRVRNTAAVEVIDFNDSAEDSELTHVAGVRTSKWGTLLDNLYDATAAESSPVPRDAEGHLKFVRLGSFNNPGGARTQVKAFEAKGLDGTYEFKTVVKGGQSFLWARVREVA